MIKALRLFKLLVLVVLFFGCTTKTKKKIANVELQSGTATAITYAQGFSIESHGDYKVLHVESAWPGSEKTFSYALVPKEKQASLTLPNDTYDAIIATPIERMVVTSTTHIPALESLDGMSTLVGFPETDYISSMPARELISRGKIKNLGNNESLNTEMVIAMQPDAVIGFAVDNQNSSYETIIKSNIPVIYNGDWTEQSPLGKAEWIKFFGVLLRKEKKADSLFTEIEAAYQEVKSLAAKAKNYPTVLSGALYKDVWYLPAGDSWACQFLKDAHVDYLWKNSEGTGSLSLSVEAVLEKGSEAEFWISPSGYTAYAAMQKASTHYERFRAFQNKKMYTFSATKGSTGGLLYYELGPQRPDMVLKDLVHIFHPNLLPDHSPFFFKPLQ